MQDLVKDLLPHSIQDILGKPGHEADLGHRKGSTQ